MESKKCKFNGCDREALENSEYCVLHESFDRRSKDEIERLADAKLERFLKEIEEGQTNFEGCILPGVDLSEKTLKGFNFEDRKFEGVVDFTDSIFGGEVSFKNCIFTDEVYFENTEFREKVSFEDAKFKEYANFIGATFNKEADFKLAIFNDVSFYDAKFKDVALFNEAEFNGFVRFEGGNDNPVFYSEVEFNDVSFKKPDEVEFIKVDLSKASFINANIEDVRFIDVKWEGKGRIFRRKAIYDEILIDKGEFEDYELVADVYRRLRASYEKRLQYPYAGDFYIGEMEMKRKNAKFRGKPVKNRFFRFILQNFSLTAFYKYFSLYGENYWLPLIWVLSTIVFFGYVFKLIGIHNPWVASMLTFFQMPPKYIEAQLESNLLLSTVVISERLAGVLFMALFVLALRRKFKKTSAEE